MTKSTPPPGTRVGIYARFSTNNQTYESIERQVTDAKRFAASKGWVVAGVWEDVEKTGTTFVGREGFFQMMAAADRGDFQVLLVEDLSRLSRKSGDTHSLYDELTELGIDIFTVARGRLVEDVDVMVGAYKNAKDVEEAAYRSRGGQVRVIESGRCAGKVAYGYRKVFRQDGKNGEREIDEAKAAIVRRLFEETAAGLSPNQICANLNREGDQGPNGKGWRQGALVGAKQIGGGILRNPIYIGEIRWGKTERKRKKGKITYKAAPASKLSTSSNPELAIVDRELFDQVQLILANKTGRRFFECKKAQYVFTGKYLCGLCGETMIVLSGRLGCTGRNVKGNLCANRVRVPREDAERAVLKGLPDKLLQRNFIEPCVEAYRVEAEKAMESFGRQMSADTAKLVAVEKQIANLWPLINDLSTPAFAKQALMGQLNTLEAERQRLGLEVKQRPPRAPATLDADQIINRLKAMLPDLSQILQGKDRDAVVARDTLRSMVDTITVTPDLSTADRRGSAEVHLKVEGSLTRLLDLADVPVNRDMKHPSRTDTVLDVATIAYAFTTSFSYHSGRLADVYGILPVVSRLLDEAQAPVMKGQIVAALGVNEDTNAEERQGLEVRVRCALDYLMKRGLIRSVLARQFSGWVWNDTTLTDAEWHARALHRPENGPLPRVVKARAAPEASVVVIGLRQGLPAPEARPGWPQPGDDVPPEPADLI